MPTNLPLILRTCRTLLVLQKDQSPASAYVKPIADEHLRKFEANIVYLVARRDTLSNLVQACSGDGRPDCPILKGMEHADHPTRKA